MIDNAYIISADGKTTKQVQDLGWLLRNWKDVQSFQFTHTPGNKSQDGILSARMKDGRIYTTGFACLSVCRNFLNRPIFRTLTFTVDGINETI